MLLQDCYLLGYFPKCRKQDSRIYMKTTDKDNYHTFLTLTGPSCFPIFWVKSMKKLFHKKQSTF